MMQDWADYLDELRVGKTSIMGGFSDGLKGGFSDDFSAGGILPNDAKRKDFE